VAPGEPGQPPRSNVQFTPRAGGPGTLSPYSAGRRLRFQTDRALQTNHSAATGLGVESALSLVLGVVVWRGSTLEGLSLT
jgi:hypothetical protein